MESHRLAICRALLRACRGLGPRWAPAPHASDQLWGQGFPMDPRAVHPLLVHAAPPHLREVLAVGARQPFAEWLRSSLRSELCADSDPILVHRLAGDPSLAAATLEFLRKQSALAGCSSSSEANGLRVDAVSGFMRSASDVGKGRYVFTYNIRFTNTGTRRLRVLSRQYDFLEATGVMASQIKPDQPEGAGVVGFTPLLAPGTSFEFGSGVVLRTARGSVTGSFLVMEEPQLEGEDAQLHEAMEGAELVVRCAYLKGLGTPLFHLPLGKLHFDTEVQCVSYRKG